MNIATRAGFTREIEAEGGEYSLRLLIRPNTDLDSTFKAWCLDEEEFIVVNGWMFSIEETESV